MLKNTPRTVASAITLDFLVPRLILRRNAASVPAVDLTSPKKPKIEHAPKPSSSASLLESPAKLFQTLERQLQTFNGQLATSPTDSQAEIFNKSISELRQALDTVEVPRAWRAWNALKSRKLLTFFGPNHHNMCSNLVANIFNPREERLLSAQDMEAVEEIAVVSAADGYPAGLKAYMLSRVKQGDSEGILRAYSRYYSLLEEKKARHTLDDDEKNMSDQEDVASAADNDSTARTLVRGDILLLAITAHVMQDAYSGALELTLRASTPVYTTLISQHLRSLSFNRALRDKLSLFLPRLDLQRLLSRPASFSRQMANLTRDQATRSLERLYASILSGLGGARPWLAVDESAKNADRPVALTNRVWTLFITAFMRCQRNDLVEKLWDDMVQLGIRPAVDAWNSLIDGYAEQGAVDRAIATFELMRKQGVQPDALSHRGVIHALFKGDRPEDGLRTFRTFQNTVPKLLPPPEESILRLVYNTTIHGLLHPRHRRDADAYAILKEMENKGVKPDIATYNTFLIYHARNGDLKRMADVLGLIEPAGLVGDVVTFSIALTALLRVRSDAPDIVIKLMKKQGLEPNATTLTALIDHQMDSQTETGFRAAMQLLGKMESSEDANVKPNGITYTSILARLHRGDWLDPKFTEEYTQQLWQRMHDRDIRPTRATYHILIRACLENDTSDGLQHGLRYYREMIKGGVFVTNDTWYILLHGLLRRKELAVATEVVDEMSRLGVQPSSGALFDLVRRIRTQARARLDAGPASFF